MKSRSPQSLFIQFREQGLVVAALVPLFIVVFMAGSYHDDKVIEDSRDLLKNEIVGDGKFNDYMTKDGVKAKLLIIDLENMNMKDPNGATHHVVVRFFNSNTGVQLKNISGKFKLVDPSEETFVTSFKDSKGVFAANFPFSLPGRYKVFCHAEIDGKNPQYQFIYNKL